MAKELYLNNEEHKVLTKHLIKYLENSDQEEVLRDILLKIKYKFYFDPQTIERYVGVPLSDKWNFVHDECGWDDMEEFHNLLWDFLLQVEDKEFINFMKN